jgi:hypothetical protein
MVNTSSHNNKTKHHISPQLIEHNKITTTYYVENPGHGLGKAHKCGEVESVDSTNNT